MEIKEAGERRESEIFELILQMMLKTGFRAILVQGAQIAGHCGRE